MISDPKNKISVSAASVWEIAIKHALKRNGVAAIPISAKDAIKYFGLAGYVILPISPAHAAAVEALPHLHGDPFDRLLVAQAMSEPMRLLTHDPALMRYSDAVIQA